MELHDILLDIHALSVTTFDHTVKEGLSARHVYQQCGFHEHHSHHPTPAGIPTVVMIRAKDHQETT